MFRLNNKAYKEIFHIWGGGALIYSTVPDPKMSKRMVKNTFLFNTKRIYCISTSRKINNFQYPSTPIKESHNFNMYVLKKIVSVYSLPSVAKFIFILNKVNSHFIHDRSTHQQSTNQSDFCIFFSVVEFLYNNLG